MSQHPLTVLHVFRATNGEMTGNKAEIQTWDEMQLMLPLGGAIPSTVMLYRAYRASEAKLR